MHQKPSKRDYFFVPGPNSKGSKITKKLHMFLSKFWQDCHLPAHTTRQSGTTRDAGPRAAAPAPPRHPTPPPGVAHLPPPPAPAAALGPAPLRPSPNPWARARPLEPGPRPTWDPGELKPQHLSATTHLHNNHMYGAVNIGAFIKYCIGAFNIQLTEYNHNI